MTSIPGPFLGGVRAFLLQEKEKSESYSGRIVSNGLERSLNGVFIFIFIFFVKGNEVTGQRKGVPGHLNPRLLQQRV